MKNLHVLSAALLLGTAALVGSACGKDVDLCEDGANCADAGLPPPGGTDAGTTDGGGELTYDEVCSQILPTLCEFMVRCGMMHSQARCEEQFAAEGSCDNELKARLEEGRATFDATKAEACLAHVAASTTCGASPFDSGPCVEVFAGAVPSGGSCYTDDECAPGHYCRGVAPDTCPASCVPLLSEGDLVGPDERCGEGLSEYFDGTETRCQALVEVGESCAPLAGGLPQRRCVDGAECNDAEECQAYGAEGDACNPVPCRENLQCSEGQCIPWRGLDAPCAYSTNTFCKFDLHCEITAPEDPMFCRLRGSEGDACLMSAGCRVGLFCERADPFADPLVFGTCEQPRGEGADCVDPDACEAALYCDPTVDSCAPRRALGEPCDEFDHPCADGLACNQAGMCEAVQVCAP